MIREIKAICAPYGANVLPVDAHSVGIPGQKPRRIRYARVTLLGEPDSLKFYEMRDKLTNAGWDTSTQDGNIQNVFKKEV